MNDLVATVEGDLEAFRRLLSEATMALPQGGHADELVLSRKALRRVLESFIAGTATSEQLERWAGFMRWGIRGQWRETGSTSASGRPIRISFQEDPLVTDIIARLDEIPDDGPPTQDEAIEWNRQLQV